MSPKRDNWMEQLCILEKVAPQTMTATTISFGALWYDITEKCTLVLLNKKCCLIFISRFNMSLNKYIKEK